jgi:rhamnosyltransferase
VIPAATVTFHPDPGWPARLLALCREHPRVIVVDNSTQAEARAFVAATVAATPGASLFTLPSNPGIGHALNLAFNALNDEGHAWAVVYDQDSTPSPGFVAALTATSKNIPRAAIVGANWSDPKRPTAPARFLRARYPLGLGFRRDLATRDLDNVICVITSGALFNLSVWRSLNGFSADLFLDLVDTDYCLRARRAGHDVAASAAAQLTHHRGNKTSRRLLGREFHPANTPPFRLHCLARNRVLLFRRHRFRPLAWVAYEIAYAAKLVFDALLLEKHSWLRLKATLQGTWDGILGHSGPVPPHGR